MIKRSTFQEWMPILLVWLCFVLLPIKRSVEIPVFIMAILGLWGFMRGGWRHATTGSQGAFGLIMLSFWGSSAESVEIFRFRQLAKFMI